MSDLLKVTLPILVGALVAALSAAIKTLAERRDARLTAHRQLDLATKRTEFVRAWLEVSRSIQGDEAFVALANSRARDELDEAYTDAQQALAHGKATLEQSRQWAIARQLRSLLLLERRRRVGSYVVVLLFYATIAYFWIAAVVDWFNTEDEYTWFEATLGAVIATVLCRLFFGWVVGRMERPALVTSRASASSVSGPLAAPQHPSTSWRAPPPPG